MRLQVGCLVGCAAVVLTAGVAAAMAVEGRGDRALITGNHYRVAFARESMNWMFEVFGADQKWHRAAERPESITFAYFRGDKVHGANGLRATWALEKTGEWVVVGQQGALDPAGGVILDLHYLCVDSGLLIGARLARKTPDDGRGCLWSPPRIALGREWDSYLFWAGDGRAHEGQIAQLAPYPAYAGVSPWEKQGDTVASLEPARPALILNSSSWGVGLGVVFVDYAARWAGSHMFLQQHTATARYLYGGYSPAARAERPLWSWLAPFPRATTAEHAARVEKLVREGEKLTETFHPISPPVPEAWTRPVPDFPAELRRSEPVRDLNEAVVFTINEFTRSDREVDLARKVGSDVLIRAWFKWNQAPPVKDYRDLPVKVHQMGALFGGGITCSALYDRENGITEAQLHKMATRGPAGQLIDAWDTPGIRHGSLSSPAYLEYLFRWCREQIDAGADYLFMDEHTAAISGLEGYDDPSLSDFRRYLLEACPQTRGWSHKDPRWVKDLKVDLTSPQVCPTGAMDSFDYRAFLRTKSLLEKPMVPENSLGLFWNQFRAYRDDRAWKTLTDRIRAYAKQQGRTVYLSANGIAKYVDLQVLGVWGAWLTDEGHIDLSQNQLPYWRSLVVRGQVTAERRVPVVLFHDWGFGDPPFPWLAVPPSEREIWMRTRGAEIYAAGGFFAFPVLGPFDCDASRDGTLSVVATQTAFYQTHRDLYLRGRYVGTEALESKDANLSLAAWWTEQPRALLLHVINRDFREGRLQPRKSIVVKVPVDQVPESITLISPDWRGERPGACRKASNGIEVTLAELDAYGIAVLRFAGKPDLSRLRDPARIMLDRRWARPERNEFRVQPDALVEHANDLNGFLQGMLHNHLRNPPTFLVNAAGQAELLVKVQAVAAAGARIEYRVDGETKQTVDLPDLDGKNAADAAEYDRVFSFPIGAGRHRITLDNVGGDWAALSWLEFKGAFSEW